jgi:Type I phosphodiesterase / nucleotide pyrophosphatase
VRKLLVVSCAALGADVARRADFDRFGELTEIEPVFPALTIPAQATLLTGLKPAEHGGVANGFFNRELRKAFFWEQSANLVSGQRVWEQIEHEHSEACGAGLLFFQNSIGTNADTIITPAPLHGPDGKTISACYTRPPILDAELEAELGPFPLHKYWGPMAGLDSSRWIVESTRMVLETHGPELLFSYLPHLDYDFQRFGPNGAEADAALADLSMLLEELAGVAGRHGYQLVVVGDYAIEPAEGFALPNLALREEGLLGIRRVGKYELPDMGSSLLFAVVDHQIAHVYCLADFCPHAAVDVLDGLAGVGRILDREAQKDLGVAHPRGGDLILEAAPGHWFAYDWWVDEECAPPYARTVDIHNKPGYDPLELFMAADGKGTARDGNLVKGTHGRAGGGAAALILPEKWGGAPAKLAATEVSGLLCRLAGG